MKREIDMSNNSHNDTFVPHFDYPTVWQCVLYYCATRDSLDIVLQARFVSTQCWSDELALLGCQRLHYDDNNDSGDPREKFDQLYRHAYRFARLHNPSSPCLPFKQHHKYATMGPVLKFLDWDDIEARRKLDSQAGPPPPQRGRGRGEKPFDRMRLEFGGDWACQLEAEDEWPCESASCFCYVGEAWLYENNKGKVSVTYQKYKGYNKAYMQQIVGKVLVGLWLVTEANDYLPEQDSDDNDEDALNAAYNSPRATDREDRITYVFVAQDGQQFPFLLHHHSNGYYSGSLHCEWEFPDSLQEAVITDPRSLSIECHPNAEIIIVVGLPASGKSTYVRERYGGTKGDGDDTLIFDDDELEGYEADMLGKYFVQMTLRHLRQNKKVCFVSPRFCRAKHYEKFLNGFPDEIVRDTTVIVRTVLFENNPSQCIENNKKRMEKRLEQQTDKAQAQRDTARIEKDIWAFSLSYRPFNVAYRRAEHVNVYKPLSARGD